ncbi:hypothetical protein Glove_465g38 [Diversispora epigaea]|uniref:F-box domain-containing protein n=1 Tax=Diversispora epigaea TaxID=1348612 RepID=A0A397GM40_9GLOM|nr:hypothetical protein Glove_465g38 [Diversispora epigaea]
MTHRVSDEKTICEIGTDSLNHPQPQDIIDEDSAETLDFTETVYKEQVNKEIIQSIREKKLRDQELLSTPENTIPNISQISTSPNKNVSISEAEKLPLNRTKCHPPYNKKVEQGLICELFEFIRSIDFVSLRNLNKSPLNCMYSKQISDISVGTNPTPEKLCWYYHSEEYEIKVITFDSENNINDQMTRTKIYDEMMSYLPGIKREHFRKMSQKANNANRHPNPNIIKLYTDELDAKVSPLCDCNKVNDIGIRQIIQCFNLEYLALNFLRFIDDKTICIIVQSCPNIRYLDLEFCYVTNIVVNAIAQSCRNMEYLNIYGSESITDSSMSKIAKKSIKDIAQHLSNLKYLGLKYCVNISEEALNMLDPDLEIGDKLPNFASRIPYHGRYTWYYSIYIMDLAVLITRLLNLICPRNCLPGDYDEMWEIVDENPNKFCQNYSVGYHSMTLLVQWNNHEKCYGPILWVDIMGRYYGIADLDDFYAKPKKNIYRARKTC